MLSIQISSVSTKKIKDCQVKGYLLEPESTFDQGEARITYLE